MLTPLLLASAGFDRMQNTARGIHPDLKTGKVLKRRLSGQFNQTYYLYIPRKARKSAPLMVSIHGVSRNAKEHAEMMAAMAERYGVILLAPLFNRKQFPDYQRLGRIGRGPRADLALDRIIGEVLYLTGASTEQLHLFGYSGGGQFAHRYAMAHPQRVTSVVIGAAGWYTFPDSKKTYPRGTRSNKTLPSLRFDESRFLRIPMTVLVGDQDCERDAELNKLRRIDRQQGMNRVERATNWVESMNQASMGYGITPHHRLTILPGIGHSFEQGIKRANMDEIIFSSLFGTMPASHENPRSNSRVLSTSCSVNLAKG